LILAPIATSTSRFSFGRNNEFYNLDAALAFVVVVMLFGQVTRVTIFVGPAWIAPVVTAYHAFGLQRENVGLPSRPILERGFRLPRK
jgi:L-asparagine transporter-like permease